MISNKKNTNISLLLKGIGNYIFVLLCASNNNFAYANTIEQWDSETVFVRNSIETETPETFSFVEDINGEKIVAPNKKNIVIANEKKEDKYKSYEQYDFYIDGLQQGEVERVAKAYRQILANTSVKENNNFIVTASDDEPLYTNTNIELEQSKTYTVGSNGKLLEVKENYIENDFYKQKKIVGNGWVVSAQPLLISDQVEISVTKKEQKFDTNFSNASASSNTGSNLTTTLRGKIVLPTGYSPESIRVRIAGSSIEVVPMLNGEFEIPEFPLEANAELLIWDVLGKVNRRIIPVSGDKNAKIYNIVLESTNILEATVNAFGNQQNMRLAAFCGIIKVPAAHFLIGAKVKIMGATKNYKPYFFNETSLPDATLVEPMDSNGKICAFNIEDELIDIDISLVNGKKRKFAMHLKPTIYENAAVFDMDKAVYREAKMFELVDFEESLKIVNSDKYLLFGAMGTRNWFDGSTSANWAMVSGLFLSGDNSYAPKLINELNSKELNYFSTAEEFSEIRWGNNPNSYSGFSLMSKFKIEENKKNDHSPLVVKAIDKQVLFEMEQTTGAMLDSQNGAAFVDIDTARIGVEYSDLRVLIKDVWTGKNVGKITFIKPTENSINPKFVRFFVSSLPIGQHLLEVTDKYGAIKWLDIIRTRSELLQVISVN